MDTRNFNNKGLILINNNWIYFNIKKANDCLFSRRNGYEGFILFGYSFYLKLR